jgi:hypothetical protein
MRELLADLLIYGAAFAGAVAGLGLVAIAVIRVWTWWQTGRQRAGVSVVICITR